MQGSLKLRAQNGWILPVAIAGFPVVVKASLSYSLVRLDGQSLYGYAGATSLNDSGQVIVNTGVAEQTSGQNWDSYVWHNGLEKHFPSVATAINNRGEVAMQGADETITRADGSVQHLPLPANEREVFSVLDLNDSDQAVGFGYAPKHGDALFWDHGTLHNLGNFGQQAQATRINNDGQILIEVNQSDNGGENQALLWKNNKSTAIKVAAGDSVQANDLNDAGEVVGSVSDNNSHVTAFSWRNGVMQDLPPLPGDQFAAANGINDMGQIVGVSWTDWQTQHPVIWENGKVINLLPEIAGSDNWSQLRPTGINDDGLIVGDGMFNGLNLASAQDRAFALQPRQAPNAAPLPAGVWMGLMTAPLLVWSLKRSRRATA